MIRTMNSPLWRAGAATALLVFAPAVAFAQSTVPSSLTLEQAVAMARENNPDFLATANDQRSANAGVRAARDAFLPTAQLNTSVGYTAAGTARYGAVDVGSNPAVYTSGFSLSAGMELSASTLLQPGVARAQARATTQRIAGAAADLDAQVKQLYLSALQAQEGVEQAQREVTRTSEYVRLAQAKLDVGAGTPLDLRRAEVQQGQAEVTLLQARNTLATARIQLAQAIGVVEVDSTVRLATPFEVFEPRWSAAELVEMSLRNNPTLLSVRANEDATETQVKAARSAYLPSLGLSFNLNGSSLRPTNLDEILDQAVAGATQSYQSCLQSNQIRQSAGLPAVACNQPSASDVRSATRSQFGTFPFGYNRQPWSLGLGISFPLLAGPQRRQRIEEARVSHDDAQLRVRSQELKLRTDVATALVNVSNGYQTVQLQSRVVERSTEELRLAQERFRFGASNSLEVIDAQTNLSQAERDRIDAVYNFHKSLALLEALVGQPLR